VKLGWILGALALALAFAFASLMAVAAPQRPIDPTLELAHDLPPYRASLAGSVKDFSAAMAQAHILVDEGRRLADIRPFEYADRILAPYVAQISGNTELALLRADIQQYRHDFNGAVGILDQVLARDPRNPSARLMRAQIRVVQGRGQDATQDCMSLVGREAVGIWSTCAAQALAISGRLPQAQRLLEASLRGDPISGARGSWTAGVMAELALQNGDRVVAEAWLQRAIAADPDDHVAAIELIDLWNENGRSAISLDLMNNRPASDAFLIRKAIALRNLGDRRGEAIVTELTRRFAEADELGDRTHLRERAAFELQFGKPQAALAHAQENFRSQRELVDLRLLLQCAVAAHAADGAIEGLKWLRESHVQDERLSPALALLGISP
jgi:tetratricopeptide (TPR) repeat protein